MNQPSQTEPTSNIDPERIAVLHADLEAARGQLARVDAEYQSMLANQDTIQEDRDATAQLLVEAQAAVTRVENALARTEAGTAGQCERCGSEIPEERLAALPDASTCVACA
jgi:RNA polymerase-binding transcription factor DksA